MAIDQTVVPENSELKKATILTSLITSFITVIFCLLTLVFWLQPIKSINQNKKSIEQYQNEIAEIRKSITISREELELQVIDYIDKNYGELSERDEKVDKLNIYFRQQDARLSNIEKALSKF